MRDAPPMSDPWSNPPEGGEQPPPPPGGGAPPPPPPTPGWSAPPPPPPSTPSWSAPPPPPGYGGGSGYGPTPAYSGVPAGAGQKTNTLAITSLVTGIIAVLTCSCFGVLGIAAVVTGVLGRNQIKESNGLEQGDGMALAGLITGAVSLVLGLAWLIFRVAAFS